MKSASCGSEEEMHGARNPGVKMCGGSERSSSRSEMQIGSRPVVGFFHSKCRLVQNGPIMQRQSKFALRRRRQPGLSRRSEVQANVEL